MGANFTNDFTIVKDIIKTEYQFILSLLFTNFSEIIHLLKEKQPLQGEILEYLYLSVPSYYNSTHDKICEKYRYIDSVIRVIYKNHKDNHCDEINNTIQNICKDFHIEANEVSYYYFVALVIIYLESSINVDAYNLYIQLSDDVIEDIKIFLKDLINILNKTEFQCLFYNHLEDVYECNLSIDGKVSVLHKENYSFFLDSFNKDMFFAPYFPINDMYSYPIIITDEFIYNVQNGAPYMLEANNIRANIFSENVRYIATYYPTVNVIRNWVPFFNIFKIDVSIVDDNLLKDLYMNYVIKYNINDTSSILNSQNFLIYNGALNNIHYYVDKFTVYSTDILLTKEDNKNHAV